MLRKGLQPRVSFFLHQKQANIDHKVAAKRRKKQTTHALHNDETKPHEQLGKKL